MIDWTNDLSEAKKKIELLMREILEYHRSNENLTKERDTLDKLYHELREKLAQAERERDEYEGLYKSKGEQVIRFCGKLKDAENRDQENLELLMKTASERDAALLRVKELEEFLGSGWEDKIQKENAKLRTELSQSEADRDARFDEYKANMELLRAENEALKTWKEGLSIFGTDGCVNCETGRVTLFSRGRVCIKCQALEKAE